ncbi:MAG: ArsR/SmtB family transcription factor [Elusimicrobiota bacterium]
MKKLQFHVNTAKALGDGSRMRTVAALMHCGELCVCQIRELLGFAPSTVSRHISLLHSAQLVESRKSGRWVYYRLSESIPDSLKEWIKNNVFNTPEAVEDRKRLEEIVSCDPKELCEN